jgi:hypothetical protein
MRRQGPQRAGERRAGGECAGHKHGYRSQIRISKLYDRRDGK